jgi:hypothetical protein
MGRPLREGWGLWLVATFFLNLYVTAKGKHGSPHHMPHPQVVHTIGISAAVLPKWYRKQAKDSEEPGAAGVPQGKEGGMPQRGGGGYVDGHRHFPLQPRPFWSLVTGLPRPAPPPTKTSTDRAPYCLVVTVVAAADCKATGFPRECVDGAERGGGARSQP